MASGQSGHPKNAREAFLAFLTECGNVSDACKQAKVGRNTVYTWRKDDPEFAALWDEAAELGIAGLEDEARRRAHQGTEKWTTVAGKARRQREYSDTLLIFLLKAARPDTYRERSSTEITGKDGKPLVPEQPLSDIERASRIAQVLAAARARAPGSDAAGDGQDLGAAPGPTD